MSKSVLLSIKPKYCELIASGKKTIEVRKTKPKLDTPFKCYIYCTKVELLTRSHYNSKIYVASSPKYQKALERNGNITLSGKVIGEFVCDEIIEILPDNEIYGTYDISDDEVIASGLIEEGISIGEKTGAEKLLIELVKDKIISIAEAAKRAGMTEAQFSSML